jgi:hypothetical protein
MSAVEIQAQNNCVSAAALQVLSSSAEPLFEFLWRKITSNKLLTFFAIEKIFARPSFRDSYGLATAVLALLWWLAIGTWLKGILNDH